MCAVSKSTAETSTCARALVDGLGQALGQRVGRLGREADDLEPGFGKSSELAAQRVELAVSAHRGVGARSGPVPKAGG
jgi:hypothetical protein